MSIPVLNIGAIACYIYASYRMARILFSGTLELPPVRNQVFLVGTLAITLHFLVLYHGVVTTSGFNLGVFSAGSLVAWLIALFVLVAALYRPLMNLTVIVFPVAAAALAFEALLPGHRILPMEAPLGLRMHVVLSITAYSLLSIAALQAIMLAVADQQLRSKRPGAILGLLPPLQTMEELLFQLITLGFFLLTLGLLSGFMFVEDLFAQHLVHKTTLSIIAWLVFAVLLWGRRAFGWRGPVAVRYTLGGFVFLMLAFFGSKFVLELILKRV